MPLTVDEKSELMEKLAAIEHERWADWMSYLISCGARYENPGFVLPASLVDAWQRQIDTPYADLSEAEKQSDRDQVARYWDLINATDG